MVASILSKYLSLDRLQDGRESLDQDGSVLVPIVTHTLGEQVNNQVTIQCSKQRE